MTTATPNDPTFLSNAREMMASLGRVLRVILREKGGEFSVELYVKNRLEQRAIYERVQEISGASVHRAPSLAAGDTPELTQAQLKGPPKHTFYAGDVTLERRPKTPDLLTDVMRAKLNVCADGLDLTRDADKARFRGRARHIVKRKPYLIDIYLEELDD